jgi:hypothetical protein
MKTSKTALKFKCGTNKVQQTNCGYIISLATFKTQLLVKFWVSQEETQRIRLVSFFGVEMTIRIKYGNSTQTMNSKANAQSVSLTSLERTERMEPTSTCITKLEHGIKSGRRSLLELLKLKVSTLRIVTRKPCLMLITTANTAIEHDGTMTRNATNAFA